MDGSQKNKQFLSWTQQGGFQSGWHRSGTLLCVRTGACLDLCLHLKSVNFEAGSRHRLFHRQLRAWSMDHTPILHFIMTIKFFFGKRAKHRFWHKKRGPSCANWGQVGGSRWFGQCPKENIFFSVDPFPNHADWLDLSDSQISSCRDGDGFFFEAMQYQFFWT